MKWSLGEWGVRFDESSQRLTFSHKSSGVVLDGVVCVKVGGSPWRVGVSRDAVSRRLALLTPNRRVQGYVMVSGDGGRVTLRVEHRTAQSYRGELSYDAHVSMANAFACRVKAPLEHRVVQMGAGLTDSLTNDSLFDRETDRCLTFGGARRLVITTEGEGEFRVRATLAVDEASVNALEVSLVQDFYRRNYVPYYQPIDRKRCPSPPTGWMSWNVYFDQATAEDNLNEARIGQKQLQPFGMEFWSMESWQGDSDCLPVSSFDNLSLKSHKTQFPEGMKVVADEIRRLGFRPGIWTAPFGTGSDEFYESHKDWFLHDEEGKPLSTWNGKYTIDPSNDELIDWLREYHRVCSREWGYEFFKIDGMSGRDIGYCAHFFEMDEVRARFKNPACPDPFERCVRAFREGIGEDRVFLACQGHYTGPEAQYADASRIGGDIVAPNTTSNWNNILSQANATLAQLFVNNIVFWMDPDTMLVGEYHSLEEARVTAMVVSLPGQMMFAGDRLATLPPERMRLLQQALPVCDTHPMNLYPIFDRVPVWDLKVARPWGSYDVVALFNWTEKDGEIGFEFADLGLPEGKFYAIHEFFTNEFQDIYEDSFSMPVPAHGVRLVTLHEEQPHPQFLSSDRHFTQGAVDVMAMEWDDDACTMSGAVKLVGGHPTTLTFLLPETYVLRGSKSLEAKLTLKKNSDDLVRITLESPESELATFTLEFREETEAEYINDYGEEGQEE